MERRDFVTSAIAMAGAAIERWGRPGDGVVCPGVLSVAEVRAANRAAVGVGPKLFRACSDSGAEPDGDGSGRCVQAGYRSGDADILFVNSGNLGGSAGDAGHEADRGCGVHESVGGVLGSAGVGTGICASGEFADVSVRGLAEAGCAEGREENLSATDL